jgi:hypothetical protein
VHGGSRGKTVLQHTSYTSHVKSNNKNLWSRLPNVSGNLYAYNLRSSAITSIFTCLRELTHRLGETTCSMFLYWKVFRSHIHYMFQPQVCTQARILLLTVMHLMASSASGCGFSVMYVYDAHVRTFSIHICIFSFLYVVLFTALFVDVLRVLVGA